MFKNQLQELAQRSCFNLPSYACIREGPDHAPRFKATVNFNGETFDSPTFCSTLRQAEHAAAEVALNTLSKRGPSRSLAAKVLDETGIYKNLLQESAHKAGLKLPVYTTVRSGAGNTPIFTCTVELAGMSFAGDPAKTKKQAQKHAAIAAWSSLKHLSHSGTSSPSTSSHLETEEQEQMVVARALAKLHQSEESSPSSPNDRQRSQQRPASWRNPHPTSNLCFYPMPPQNWVYPNFASEAAMYQMWHQAPPLHTRDPTFIPVQQSVYQPNQVSFLPSVDQNQLSSPYLPVYFSDYSASVPLGGGRYPAVLGKTHEKDVHGERKERGNSHPSDVADSSRSTDASRAQKPLQVEEAKCASCGFNSDHSVSCPFAARGSDDLREPQDMKADRRSQRKTFGLLPRDWSPAPSYSFVCDQDREFRIPSSLRPSGPKGSALRPQISSTIQTAIPGCSARSSPCFVAPPVTVRSAIPVFSAPPATMKPEANQKPNHEKEIIADVSAKFVKLRI
ncbi:double-stranded RNA-binding protein 2-like isoform X1 [Zingiber officinale]|nr:double-stranded RNA-binding protein 2-like isoform X1 [Zingiber officinale]